jgi:hypothetical protein
VKILKLFVVSLGLAGTLVAGQIGALTPSPLPLVALGGPVVVYWAGSSAAFQSQFFLVQPTTVGPFFNNSSSTIGDSLTLGSFSTGTVLKFELDVLTTGNQFFTGPASGNPDGIVHAAYAGWAADTTIAVNGVLVGFEDVFNAGPGILDYDDNKFVITGAIPAPEPASWMLIACGLGAAAGFSRRYRR